MANKEKLKILLVSTEVTPFSKSGGLGDVAGSLPKALRARGVDIRVVLPQYRSIREDLLTDARYLDSFTVHLSWRAQSASIRVLDGEKNSGVPVYFIENDFYFGRDAFYGYGDDYERFAFFSKASIEFLNHVGFQPDILHFNDWHTGLGCTYLRDVYRPFLFYANMKSLFTIHNLHFQGVFERELLWAVGLNDGYFTGGQLEFYGNISYLKAGLVHSDAVNTVSETYAEEIQTPTYGFGMDGLLRQRNLKDKRLFGILNGIDTELNDPKTDKRIYVNFDADHYAQKKENKYKLQERLGLPVGDTPLLSIISRLTDQKGLDIVAVALDELVSRDIQLVVLGTGEGRYENLFRTYAWRHPDKVSANILFSDELAQKIYAASDIFLMPSVYEPCGLGQLFAMRYGAAPIVRKTGGLADTVTHFDPAAGKGNGFVFEDFLASGLMWAVNQALDLYGTDDWLTLFKNAINSDFSWDKSAGAYRDLYQRIKDEF